MQLVDYYDYIMKRFQRLLGNKQLAEDHTQELYVHYIAHGKDKRKGFVGLKFVHKLINHTLYYFGVVNRALKRQGTTCSLDNLFVPFFHEYVERIYTKELLDVVDGIKNSKLRYAIYKVIGHDGFKQGSLDDKYMQMIRHNRNYLARLVA